MPSVCITWLLPWGGHRAVEMVAASVEGRRETFASIRRQFRATHCAVNSWGTTKRDARPLTLRVCTFVHLGECSVYTNSHRDSRRRCNWRTHRAAKSIRDEGSPFSAITIRANKSPARVLRVRSSGAPNSSLPRVTSRVSAPERVFSETDSRDRQGVCSQDRSGRVAARYPQTHCTTHAAIYT